MTRLPSAIVAIVYSTVFDGTPLRMTIAAMAMMAAKSVNSSIMLGYLCFILFISVI